MKVFAERRLADQARRLISKRRPFVVGVTGSVGKSSTKQAIGAVLGGTFGVRVSPGNYNTEFGLPLAVLGLERPGRSAFGWAATLLSGCRRSLFPPKDYPDTLVLEMAADRPGDIAKLVAIAPPDIAVVTTIGESHLEFFGSAEAIADEKSVLVRALSEEGVAVLNRDDERVWSMRRLTSARVLSFGLAEDADVRVLPESVSYVLDGESCGTHFKISSGGSVVPAFVSGVVGRPAVMAAAAAAAVGLARGLNLVDVAGRLSFFDPVPGRLRCLPGIKGTVLIDDSYNAAPKSMAAAFEALHDLPLKAEDDRRFAVLGDMLELGGESERAHVQVGRLAAELDLDYLVLVGELMGIAERSAREAGMTEGQVFHFSDSEDAGRFVQERMRPGDAVLVKGSRGMHMEFVVKELMADPLHAAELLPGRHEEWKN